MDFVTKVVIIGCVVIALLLGFVYWNNVTATGLAVDDTKVVINGKYLNKELPTFTLEEVRQFKDGKALVIYPSMTESAYQELGFYTYFAGICEANPCLTVPFLHDYENIGYASSGTTFHTLERLGYDMAKDEHLHVQGEKLTEQYGTIIMLHNEYATWEMFNAIQNHPNVIYMYPNAFYGVVEWNEDDTLTLVRGHGIEIAGSGFEWEFDNTRPYEYDTDCLDWEFLKIKNGYQLNCFPELIMFYDNDNPIKKGILTQLKTFVEGEI